ncbi:MAG: adenosylcobinamide amidohydrolase [Pseudomonadota bacterium]
MQVEADETLLSELIEGVHLRCTEQYVHVRFAATQRAVSCAVYNGGVVEATDYINLRVPREPEGELTDPADTLADVARSIGCRGLTVGMMTAASTRSLRFDTAEIDGHQVAIAVTAGLHNARRAGDRAEYRLLHEEVARTGTINTVVFTTACLQPQAMIEVMTVAVEAKVAVLQELGVQSAVSEGLATGTGTDAMAVFCPPSGPAVRFGGKHTLLGERVAQLHMTALRRSLAWQAEPGQ